MFTGVLNQGAKNSCGAAILTIVAYQLKKTSTPPDISAVDSLYLKTQDKTLSEALGKKNPNDYLSPPANIIREAGNLKLNPVLLVSTDIDVKKLTPETLVFKSQYIDKEKSTPAAPADLFKRLTPTSFLEILVYLDGVQKDTHWLLLQTDGTNYGLYDTAFGTNKTLTKDEVQKLLMFDAPIVTGDGTHSRHNNFFGVAIELQ